MNSYSMLGALLLGLLFTLKALAEATPDAALDTLYKAGKDSNKANFVAVLAPDVVFLGVGEGARLQGQALRDFISESFAGGSTWDYRVSERDVRLSVDRAVAWFDESLEHGELGGGRSSGVLVNSGGAWKIVQYNLIMPQGTTTSGVAVPAVSEAPQKPECRKSRHKTNKQASC